MFWNIQSDSKSVSLNIKGEEGSSYKFNSASMTPNKEFLLLIVGQNESEVWNLKSRVKQDSMSY